MGASRNIFWMIVVIALLSGPASADHIFGIRGSLVDADLGTMEVTISVTQYSDDGPSREKEDGRGGGTTISFGASYYPALDWGDGDTTSYDNLDYVGPGPDGTAKYSREFTHTYPDTTDRTVTVASQCCANSLFFTGNAPRGTPNDPNTLTNTIAVTFGEPVPTLPNYGYPLLLLSLLVIGTGVLMLRG